MNDEWVEESAKVKEEEAKRFFEERFCELEFDRPKLDGIKFKFISSKDNVSHAKV